MTGEPASHGPGAVVVSPGGDASYRRNFALLVGEAGVFMAGLAFFDSATVYPLLLARLGASDALIGASRLVQVLGFTLPALFAAHRIHGRITHKSFMLKTCAMARVGLFTIPIVLMVFARDAPATALAWTFGMTAVFWIMDGACAVSWFDIVAKTIPARVRGRFFGTMQATAGCLAIGAGVLVHHFLKSPGLPYPSNFALLAALWFIGAMGSQIGLSLLSEPPGPGIPSDGRSSFRADVGQTGPLLRKSPRLRVLILTRILLDGAGLATPFYVLFAQRDLGVSLGMAGIYTIAQNVGRVAAGPIWGWMSDRAGFSVAVTAVAACVLAAPLAALAASSAEPWVMVVVFVLIGAVMDGVWTIMSAALLATVDSSDRPLAVGVASVCQTPSALYGPIGGLLADLTSYRVVFGAAATMAAAGVVMSLRLRRAI